ncbi:MAG: virulence-associated E family protein [Oscillospiraceae bacterium]
MIHNRQITISTAGSRKATSWQPSTLYVSELYERLKTPVRGTETLETYLGYKKSAQDDLKDVGGFVCGTFEGQRRKAHAVTGRDVITLDLDNIPAGGTQDVLRRIEGLGCGYCVYSTRKHHEAAPRLRVLFPLDRTVTADEYEPLARKAASFIGMEFCDKTTFEASRLMYYPSCSSDSVYVYSVGDKPFISADGVLAMYQDWRNAAEWAQVPGVQEDFHRLLKKQENPTSKEGIVGAFCRTYDIYHAMDEFIPGEYAPTDVPDRYTYAGGAVVYDNGLFLYSHHATDPCSGKLVNAFDLVRLHKFGANDDEATPGCPVNKLPSYAAMCEFVSSDAKVSALMAKEAFADVRAEDQDAPADWTLELTRGSNGEYQKSIKNIRLMIENLPGLSGIIRRDAFSGKITTGDSPPWARWAERKLWGDPDTTSLREFLERWFKPTKQDIKDTLCMIADRHAYHPVRDYLGELVWDGVHRLDTVFIDYLSASDTPYTRAVTRKCLTACVARVMTPGVKFDYMVVFNGKQGRGKSMIIDKLAVTQDWFSDSLVTFSGKDAMEAVQGKWLIEVPEMHAFDKAEMSVVKAFVTKRSDYYRAAYAEFAEERPRQCVLFGTTNNRACLRDTTGNRRFWPVDTGPRETARKSVYEELELERDQIWAEAVVSWRLGEKLYLDPEMEKMANEEQEAHREVHPWEDSILEFLNREVPLDWNSWDLTKRIMYWGAQIGMDMPTQPRQRICCREVWQECLGENLSKLTLASSRAINGILESQDGWKPAGTKKCGRPYGDQKAFDRVDS